MVATFKNLIKLEVPVLSMLINSVQSVEVCEFLLQSGANVNAQDHSAQTALHYAVNEKQLETTKLLLRYGRPFFRR